MVVKIVVSLSVMTAKNNNLGFTLFEAILIIFVLGIVGLVGYKVVNNGQIKQKASTGTKEAVAATSVTWAQTGSGWQPSSTPPTCPDTIGTPAKLDKVESILYPGQSRGGNYKPHGGFRFDASTNNNVDVLVSMDSSVVRATRYIEAGETQYMFDLMAPCGYMFRYDHLHTLSSPFQKIADTLPAATESSASTTISPAVGYKAGDVIATVIGFVRTTNVSFDFGVYDWNKENDASQQSAYKILHPSSGDNMSWHALCWLNILPSQDSVKVKAFPAGDMANGKASDYCK